MSGSEGDLDGASVSSYDSSVKLPKQAEITRTCQTRSKDKGGSQSSMFGIEQITQFMIAENRAERKEREQ